MNSKRRKQPVLLLMLALLCLAGWMLVRVPGSLFTGVPPEGAQATRPRVQEAFGKLPHYFIENRGQTDAQVAYYLQGRDTSAYFTRSGVTFALAKKGERKSDARLLPVSGTAEQPAQRWAVKLDFLGANPGVEPQGEERTPAVVSYFKGQPEQWKAGLPTYTKIVYRDLWPGIDLEYSGTVNRLKYQYVVQPGASVERIRLRYRGADRVRVNEAGQLEVHTPVGGFQDDKPYAYQEVAGRRVKVESGYELEGEVYGFRVGDYDRSRPLVLDPAVLVYAGYIGGSGRDNGFAIAVDGSGNAYVTGPTRSTEASFPVLVGPDLTSNGGFDAFVVKVNAAGTALVYAGYIGGSADDSGQGIAVDGSGNAYVTGRTTSTEASFPVVVGPDRTHNGGSNTGDDAFVAKVNATGTALVYSGYIGGSSDDDGYGIAVDGSGSAYVTGNTGSSPGGGISGGTRAGPDLQRRPVRCFCGQGERGGDGPGLRRLHRRLGH